MTRADYLKAFLTLINDEGPYHIVSFTRENAGEDDEQYWLTLQLPEPYTSFQAKNLLFALMFEEVDYRERTITFVIFYRDLVQVVENTKGWLKEEARRPLS